MGVVKLAFQLVLYTVIVAAVILLTPGLQPNIDFQPYKLSPVTKLEGVYSENTKLDKVELVDTAGDYIEGPESVALRGDDVFFGVNDGRIIGIINGKISTILRTGGKDCEGYWEQEKCGRPLGMRFDNQGKLLVADSYVGILRVDVDKGTAETIVPMNVNIEGGRPPHFPDDLDVDKDGVIYWSDASAVGTFGNQALEVLGQPSGRFLKYDPKTKKTTVLIDGLHFANGVQLSRNEDFVAIAETVQSRVWKYHLKGPKKGLKEILVQNLPGMPDNLRSNGKGGFYISLVVTTLESDSVNHLGPLYGYGALPTRVIIVEVDESGKVLGTLQTNTGKMQLISQLTIGTSYSYFGSPFAPALWRIKTELL